MRRDLQISAEYCERVLGQLAHGWYAVAIDEQVRAENCYADAPSRGPYRDAPAIVRALWRYVDRNGPGGLRVLDELRPLLLGPYATRGQARKATEQNTPHELQRMVTLVSFQ